MNPIRILRAATLALIAGAALTACTMGPNFEVPASTVPPVFARTQTLQAPSQPVEATFDADWWTLFDDPVLNTLEQRLADANLDVAAASARLRQSRAERRVAGAAELPTLAAAGSYDRERGSENGILSLLGVTPSAAPTQSASGDTPFGVAATPGSSGSPAYNLYQAGFDASWELDLWGRVRRGVEAADALTQASYEARNAVLLSARAELARDYLELRDAQAQLRIARQNLAIARDLEKLVRIRRKDGVTTDLDVANAAAQAASIESRLPMLESRRATRANAIGVLLAQPPGALDPILDAPHAVPGLPASVPIGLPSELAQRRPDIRQAEAQLHAATAAIGVAQADFYPRIMLNGSAGFQSLQLSSLASWASGQFVVGPSISLPIFEGGRLTGMLNLRRAQQQEAAIVYQRTVLEAWREVDDALVVYHAEQQRHDRLVAIVTLNQRALAIAQQQYRSGAADYLDVLNAERQLFEAQGQQETSEAEAAMHLVTLCKALGGGWETRFGPAANTGRADTTMLPAHGTIAQTGSRKGEVD
ncbi:efflux transporter outer membrane subunit [Burkholderia contaminans]|uniref:efflux transporter outer membrane subunit n=1 Tax=Burkholderia contaminans TaxID=488447 RepID=UPI001CF4F4C1|nr:efflux transporter outer membrane subunit [Burkholderia contaminans]MCA8101787.1 efflux transporter outer membrane subunit [Burkholderia contaminans]